MSDDGPSRGDKLLILTALLFAVRVFRSPGDPSSVEHLKPETREALLTIEARERELQAQRSALDADAILKAVEKIP